MENNNYTPGNNKAEITEESGYYLREISRWARFLAIVGFILLGIMAIGIFSSSALIYCMNETAPLSGLYPHRPGTINFPYLIICFCILLAYFFPIYYLEKFSIRIRDGLHHCDSITISEAFRFLKNHYVMIGTLTLLGLVFFVVFFVVVLMDIIRCF